jgi:hypothetical protein
VTRQASPSLIVVGAGGVGRETLELITAVRVTAQPYELAGVIDVPRPLNRQLLASHGVPWLGPAGPAGCDRKITASS